MSRTTWTLPSSSISLSRAILALEASSSSYAWADFSSATAIRFSVLGLSFGASGFGGTLRLPVGVSTLCAVSLTGGTSSSLRSLIVRPRQAALGCPPPHIFRLQRRAPLGGGAHRCFERLRDLAGSLAVQLGVLVGLRL